MSLSSSSSSSSEDSNQHSALPVVVPFDGIEYPFSMSVIGSGKQQHHLYGMDSVQETFFTAMSFSSNGVVMCSLDIVKLNGQEPITIGYFHLRDHHELVVIVIDHDTGNPTHLLHFSKITFLFAVAVEMSINEFHYRNMTVVPFHPNAVDKEDHEFSATITALEQYKEEHIVRLKSRAESLTANMLVVVVLIQFRFIVMCGISEFDPRKR